MLFSRPVSLLMLFYASVNAQRPTNESICDYYTTALFKENTAANQKTLLVKLVNTAVIGNYTTTPAPLNAVPGILAPDGGLLKYFDGSLMSSNRQDMPVAINFLDDGGAAPLMMDMPANGTSSRQYKLLTHLYEYFGALLGCTQGEDYTGQNGMFAVHKYMGLDNTEITYFISQVGLSATSFGVTKDDVGAVAMALNNTFNMRCSPKSDPIKKGSDLQAMCIAESCPLATDAACSEYPNNGVGVEPQSATASAAMPTETGGMSGNESSAMPTAGAATGAAVEVRISAALLLLTGFTAVLFM